MDRFILLCLGLAVLSYALTHLYRIVALALHIVDAPNHRSAHREITPTGAGAVFVVLFCIGMLLASLTGELRHSELIFLTALAPLCLVALLGLVDDYRHLPWRVRALAHLVAGIWGVWLVGFPELNLVSFVLKPGTAGLMAGAISLAWLINLYNFMDGVDGIAAGQAVFILLGATAIAAVLGDGQHSVPVILLVAVILGFLVINWPRAKVFMGDVGSGFLGLVLGLFTLAEVLVPVWCWLILLGWFITDACLTISMRLARGEKIYEAHALHAYQHLNRAVGTGYTLALIGAIDLFWLLPLAAVAYVYPDMGAGLLVLASVPLLVFQYYCGAGQPPPKAIAS